MSKRSFSWIAHEYTYQRKTPDWLWALGVIALSGAVAAFLIGNVLFGILIIVGTFVLSLYAFERPQLVQFEINERGIIVDNSLYPFQTLDSFWVEDSNETMSVLLVASKKTFAPLLIIPLAETPAQEVRAFLLNYLPEEEHTIPLSQQIMERLGF